MKKECYSCKESKPLEEFAVKARNADGRLGECKSCVNLNRRLARQRQSYRAMVKQGLFSVLRIVDWSKPRSGAVLPNPGAHLGGVQVLWCNALYEFLPDGELYRTNNYGRVYEVINVKS